MPPRLYQVIMHYPGPAWQTGVAFQEQPGVEDHVRYFGKQQQAGNLFAGGPFTDSTGGMVIMKPELSSVDVEAIAKADPAVISGLLRTEVRPWFQAMVDDGTE